MPKVTPAHVEARRSQILQAACKCFARKGFHGTTVRDICRESELSAGALYVYFDGKGAIVEAMAELGRRNTRALLEGTESTGRDERTPVTPGELMSRAMGVLGSHALGESTRLDLRLWGEALHTPQLHRLFLGAFENLKEPIEAAVRRGQQEGAIASGIVPSAAARVLAAICLGFEVQSAMEPDADFSGCADAVQALLDGSFVVERDEG